MKKIISSILLANMALFAFSSSSVSVLTGNFDGNSAIYDTEDGGLKSTVTFETFSVNKVGDVFGFIDYTVAEDKMLYSDDTKTTFYGEYMPRLSLSYVTGNDLSVSIFKDFYLAGQVNAGSDADFQAGLIGLGTSLNLPGFDFFTLNAYYKHAKLTIGKEYSRDTFQISPSYRLYIGSTGISFAGWMDYTGYSYQTQNQLLYDAYKIDGAGTIKVGFEHLYYYEIKDFTGQTINGDRPVSNTLQVMMQYKW